MATSFRFKTPAQQIDFPDSASKQADLESMWNVNLDGFIQQGIMGNPWNSINASGITNYFNPLVTPIPPGTPASQIIWGAFPGRILSYFATLSPEDQFSLADLGYQTNGETFPPIPENPCQGVLSQQPASSSNPTSPFGPYGPRGWLDEYCEWCVTRDGTGDIIRVDFTCENPEYWNSLWMVDPETVLQLYRDTLAKPQIQLADLQLADLAGNPVIDPSTGRPGYNPLNIWNSGVTSTDRCGGAMHLTSTPNTLQTEIGLASSATIQRTIGNMEAACLICCGQYGQPDRNSDPHIGQVANQLVSLGKQITLTNPPGLYIQMPDFGVYKTPDGSDARECWTILRGVEQLAGDDGNPLPGNFILHAKFEVPKTKSYKISGITINGQPIRWGGQIAQTITMQIVATGLTDSVPASVPCASSSDPGKTLAQPLQLFHTAVFDAMMSRPIANPVGQPMTLVSNSTLIAPIVSPGATRVPLVLTASLPPTPYGRWPTVTFDGDDLTATVDNVFTFNYAVPGNSYPSTSSALYLSVDVAPTAKLGLRGICVSYPGQSLNPAMPALLNIVASGSISPSGVAV